MQQITYTPIGIIHSPFRKPENMPIQPTGIAAAEGRVEVFPAYRAGLRDLDGFSHIILLYHFHRVSTYELEVVPYLDTRSHGLFATRAPRRPNSIGLSVVELLGMENGVLRIRNLDILDGTPLLDIKPHVPEFIPGERIRTGWLERTGDSVVRRRSDDRFAEE
jgi:tRNA-Thr(GGU) m(6)t(6)A37 methyltransferase TsaA